MAWDESTLAAMVKRTQLIDRRFKTFTVNAIQAGSVYGLDNELAERLVRLGLPCALNNDELCFDEYDLHNIALFLRLPSIYRQAMQTWANTLDAVSSGRYGTFKVDGLLLGGAGRLETQARVLGGVGDGREHAIAIGKSLLSVEVAIEFNWPETPVELQEVLLSLVETTDFCFLPEEVQTGSGFARSHGLADCVVGASWLMEECRKRDFEARTRGGLFLAEPLSFPHSWVEVRIGDRWVPYDPLLLRLIAEHTSLTAESWPLARSVGPVTLSMTDGSTKLVEVADEGFSVSYVTRLLRREDP